MYELNPTACYRTTTAQRHWGRVRVWRVSRGTELFEGSVVNQFSALYFPLAPDRTLDQVTKAETGRCLLVASAL